MSKHSQLITLNDLPPAPPGKKGWPWTEASAPFPERMPDGSEWPRISIVTPSYNQGQFIEETIRSVLLQGYPNLEYIVIDGGSTDQTIEILQKYESSFAYCHSQPDEGQSDAINQGFSRATGDIMGWLNSDDLLAKNSLFYLAEVYQAGRHWWTGGTSQILSDGTLLNCDLSKIKVTFFEELLHARLIINQVSTFWTRELWQEVGSYVHTLDLAMDFELWLRFSKYVPCTPVSKNLGICRKHHKAKTGTDNGMRKYLLECDQIRSVEYSQLKASKIHRSILILFWTRYALARRSNWKALIGRRPIPYI